MKHQFDIVARENGFKKKGKFWKYELQRYNGVHVYLELVKSRWGEDYYPWLKIYVEDMFGESFDYSVGMPSTFPAVFRAEQKNYRAVFDCDSSLTQAQRTFGVKDYFNDIVLPVLCHCRSATGIRELYELGFVDVTPPVKEELVRLGLW